MIRWKVKFRSLRTNTLYTVNIYDDQYNGVPATLLGGAQPFYTEEDNDRDWFMPVRTQTGYLNIVDTGKDLEGNDFDWMDMIPETAKSRPVTLTDENGTILWQGYLQPQTFSGRLYEPTQERSFPVMCPLSALGSIDVSVSNNGVVTFARLLSDIIYAMGGQWDWVNFQSLDSVEWLMKKVDWANFVESDSAGNRSAKYDLLTLLEEICRFWGWTCRWQGRQLWFVCPDDEMVPDYIAIEPSELYDSIDAGIVPQYQEGEWQTVSTDSDIYASVDNNVEVVLGIRKASVSADINKMTVVTEIPYDKIMDMYRNNPVQTIHEGDVYVFYLHQFSDGPAEYTFDDLHIDINSFSTPSYNGYGAFIISDGYEGDISLKHSYDWKVSLGIVGTLIGTPYASEWIYMMESLYPHNYDHGVLAISAGVDHGGVLTCRLRVGSKWWDGTAWGSTKTTFTVQVGDETDPTSGNAGKIISNRILNSSHGEYDGYGVYVETGIGGRVRFEIVGFEPNDITVMALNITALKIEFVRDKAYSLYDHDRAENVYKAVTGKEFSDETEISTIFASDDLNAFGLGIIQNYDGTYCKQVRYTYQDGNELSRPEQHLLDRIISRGKSTGLIEHVYIRSNLLDINPYTFCQTKQMTGYPIAINRQWRDDVTDVYILQSVVNP